MQAYFLNILPCVILLTIVVMLVNVALAEILHRIILKDFYKNGSSQEASQKMKYLGYAYIFVTLVLMVVVGYYLIPLLAEIISRFIAILVPFLYILVIRVGSSVIFSRTYKVLHVHNETIKEIVWEELRNLLFFLIPIFIMSYVVAFFAYFTSRTGIEISIWLFGLFVVLNMFATHMPNPYIYKFLLRAVPIKDDSAKQIIKDTFEKHDMKKIPVYQFPFKKDAIAFVVGFTRIFMSDYLITVLLKEELEAIIVHEIAHVKNYHLWKEVFINLIFSFAAITLIYGMEIIEYRFDFYVPELLNIVTGFFPLLLNGLFVSPMVSRIHERQADEYVLKSGIEPETLILALEKIISSDDRERLMSNLEEKFSTHPSLENRIKYINEFAKSMVK